MIFWRIFAWLIDLIFPVNYGPRARREMTLRILSAMLCLAYCGALRAAWRDRNSPLEFRLWIAALIPYAAIYASGIEYPTTAPVLIMACSLVVLQLTAVLEAAWLVTDLLSGRQARAVLLSALAAGIVLIALAASKVPAPHPKMPAWFWYARTALALIEVGLLAASVRYMLAKLRRPNRHEAHAGVMLLWVGAAALGHAGAVGAITVTAAHLACAALWWGLAHAASTRRTTSLASAQSV